MRAILSDRPHGFNPDLRRLQSHGRFSDLEGMRTGFLLSFYGCCIAAGCWMMTTTWDGLVYIYVGEDRSPAAVANLNEYYPVDNGVLWHPIEQQAFQNLKFLKRDNELGIRLGHFLLHDPAGHRQFACQVQGRPGVFDRIEFSFVGVGVSDDGKIPKMTVAANCLSEEDLAYLSPIWIPMSDIYHSEPKSQQLEFPEVGGTAIHFEDLASSWPEEWSLIHVRLYHSESGEPGLLLQPPQPELHEHLSFDWKQPSN
jgi:hypothetical protein